MGRYVASVLLALPQGGTRTLRSRTDECHLSRFSSGWLATYCYSSTDGRGAFQDPALQFLKRSQ